jgi:hypothetical protein
VSSTSYPKIVTDTVKANGVCGLWQLECAVRRVRGRLDADRLEAAITRLVESGRLVAEKVERTNATGRTVQRRMYRMAEGRR